MEGSRQIDNNKIILSVQDDKAAVIYSEAFTDFTEYFEEWIQSVVEIYN